MRVLITGGAGFVGSNLIAHLQAVGGYGIVVLDNQSLGTRADIGDLDVGFIDGDVRDEQALARALQGADAVVHLAADTRVMDSLADPAHNFDCNVVGTFRLLEAARRAGVRRVVNASTGGAILGEAPAPVHEAMPAAPISPYGASKLAAEGYMSAFAGAYGLSTVSLRFSNIYGPRSVRKGSVVAHFFKTLLRGEPLTVYGDGSQVRDFLYAGDLVEGIRQALERPATGVYQLGSGRPTSVNELIGEIRALVGDRLPVRVDYAERRAGEVHRTWCDVAKARRELGFASRTPLAEGLERTWRWFVERYGVERASA